MFQRSNVGLNQLCNPWEEDELHSRCFARMMLDARIAAQRARSANLKTREKHDELHNEVGCRDTHGFGDAGADFCDSKRKCATRRTIGSVPSNCWSVGDLRFALRETEIRSHVYVVWFLRIKQLCGRIGDRPRSDNPLNGQSVRQKGRLPALVLLTNHRQRGT
jgi:hypothetical protein